MQGKRGKIVKRKLLGKNQVEFTHHASQRMAARGITEDQVIRTIENPTDSGLKVNPPRSYRHRCRRDLPSGKAIDVVYEEQLDRILVVTTFVKD